MPRKRLGDWQQPNELRIWIAAGLGALGVAQLVLGDTMWGVASVIVALAHVAVFFLVRRKERRERARVDRVRPSQTKLGDWHQVDEVRIVVAVALGALGVAQLVLGHATWGLASLALALLYVVRILIDRRRAQRELTQLEPERPPG